jgi:hypothetical protein
MGPPRTQENQMLDLTRDFFEPQLANLGLSVNQIEGQSLAELDHSLERVNEAISNPGQFGVLRIAYSASAAMLVARTVADGHITEVGILPILLERKHLILDRIGKLSSDATLTSLRDLVSQVNDPEIRSQLSLQVQNYQAQVQKVRHEVAETAAQQAEALSLAQVKVSVFRERASVWLQILGRESVASVVGAVLLLAFGAAVVIGMFVRVSASTVITDSFLLILGYFFGQGVGRQARSDNQVKEINSPTDLGVTR